MCSHPNADLPIDPEADADLYSDEDYSSAQYPEAQVIGTDLSPIQPSWIPPNCVFEIDDFELPWNFTQPFDFIHARSVEGSVKDFPHLFRQAHQNLVPGGWFELMEPTVDIFSDDDSISKAPNLSEWRDMLIEASGKFGKEMGAAKNYKKWMTEAGFTDVTEEIFKVPFSPWAKDLKLKELGRYQQANMLEALDAYSLALFTRFLGWSVDQIQMLLVGVRQELLDRKLHIYSRYYLVYGRKEIEGS
ncbi:Methyltransferase domain protein [Aspergillus parasiticus SU-1]|uniref:Methyltransferase domain protein n=1 Tax=Aspergillus parasiticus (strain ATCC 56775 / NRRL 5862 / SRRC 143 / SU-1) TaxID=1403190 RepID=A0A0F0I4N3_ASPPU|nr:Methyltransferase domain protein [Aspergillus parasiticus SU-1]